MKKLLPMTEAALWRYLDKLSRIESEVIPVKELFNAVEAAREIGCTAQKVRERMKRKLWDLGEVIPKEALGNDEKNEYNIFRYKLERFLGHPVTGRWKGGDPDA